MHSQYTAIRFQAYAMSYILVINQELVYLVTQETVVYTFCQKKKSLFYDKYVKSTPYRKRKLTDVSDFSPSSE